MNDASRPQSSLNLSQFKPVPWTAGDVVWGLIIFTLWILFLIIVGLMGARLNLPIDTALLVIFGEAVLLLPVWYFTFHKYKANWSDLGLQAFSARAVSLGCGLMLLSLLFNLIYSTLLALFNLQIQPDIALMFENTTYPWVILFGGAIIAPIVEEIFFRGFVFGGLRNKWGWPRAALASAGLFAVAHVIPTSILPIFILGLIFAFLYQVSGSIWPAILMHILTNTVALLSAYAISEGWVPTLQELSLVGLMLIK